MSSQGEKLKALILEAAGIVAASHNKVGVTKAMELVGISAEERKEMKLYQQVRRRALKLNVVETKSKKTKATTLLHQRWPFCSWE
jgi:hypothetical protein